jgi:O-succinylbenzoic acid--CoA ligase
MEEPLIETQRYGYAGRRRDFCDEKILKIFNINFLQKRADENWLIGYDCRHFTQIAVEFYLELTQICYWKVPPKIILAEPEPLKFLAGFLAACAAGYPVFLCNPNWVQEEWQQVFELVQPDIIWGRWGSHGVGISGMGTQQFKIQNSKFQPHVKTDLENYLGCTQNNWLNPPLQMTTPYSGGGSTGKAMPCPYDSGLIMIPTGGSSGKIKFAMHTWETLMASVRGFQKYFQLKQVNSFCVLPLYHVSGFMQFMRSFTTGGKLAIAPFKELENRQLSNNIKPAEFFISLVPTQLQRLLQNHELTEWLSQFHTVLLGGAPAWEELLEQAKHHKIRLAPTYGMTETASQIATLKPDEFLKGKQDSGQILPHAKITICSPKGEKLGTNKPGNITIQAASLALGYYPNLFSNPHIFQPDDLGIIDNQGYLQIIGRNSNKIITGGENVFPDEVESAIRATKLVNDVCVIGIPDKHWGQAVTAIYVPINSAISPTKLQTAILDKLTKFKHPKHWLPLTKLPRNPQGKINHQQLQQLVQVRNNKEETTKKN